MTAAWRPPGLWVGQPLHFSCLALLLVPTLVVWRGLGAPFPLWFWSAVFFPVAHQVYVWLAWRLELRSAAVTRSIGFRAYLAGFFLLFGGRFISLTVLAWLDRGSLGLPSSPRVAATALLLAIGTYTLHSVKRYFGFSRAGGADHFDPRYRAMPLVREGIFRYTGNAMYALGFLLFWAIAVGFDSAAALAVAAFAHVYVWVHYHATEKPDMTFLYSWRDRQGRAAGDSRGAVFGDGWDK